MKKLKKREVLISVVIPVIRINDAEECLNSILNQTYRLLEIIIVDSSKTNDIRKMVNSKRKLTDIQIRYVKNRLRNLPISRNIGAKLASADIVSYIDDDAIAQKDWSENIHRLFSHHDDIIILGGKSKMIGKGFIAKFGEHSFDMGISQKEIDIVPGMNFSFHKKRYTKLLNKLRSGRKKYFDESLKISGEDTDFCLFTKFSLKGKIYYSPKVIIEHKYRNHLFQYLRRQVDYAIGDFIVYSRYVGNFSINYLDSVFYICSEKICLSKRGILLYQFNSVMLWFKNAISLSRRFGYRWFCIALLREVVYSTTLFVLLLVNIRDINRFR